VFLTRGAVGKSSHTIDSTLSGPSLRVSETPNIPLQATFKKNETIIALECLIGLPKQCHLKMKKKKGKFIRANFDLVTHYLVSEREAIPGV